MFISARANRRGGIRSYPVPWHEASVCNMYNELIAMGTDSDVSFKLALFLSDSDLTQTVRQPVKTAYRWSWYAEPATSIWFNKQRIYFAMGTDSDVSFKLA